MARLQTAGGAIVSLGNGKFAIWPDRNEGYTPVVDEYCVAIVSYDKDTGFTVDDNAKFPSEVVAVLKNSTVLHPFAVCSVNGYSYCGFDT